MDVVMGMKYWACKPVPAGPAAKAVRGAAIIANPPRTPAVPRTLRKIGGSSATEARSHRS